MAERKVLVKAFSGRDHKATKKERGVILNEFVLATGVNLGTREPPALSVAAVRQGPGVGWHGLVSGFAGASVGARGPSRPRVGAGARPCPRVR